MSRSSNVSLRLRWAASGAAIAVALGGGALRVVDATAGSGERPVFVAITPCRLFDTRSDNAVGPRKSPLAAGETFTQQVRGANGNCSIPGDAVAVATNVTAVNATVASFLTIWPADQPKPLASSLNWVAGAPPTPNKVDVRLSAAGAISLFNNSGTVDVLADVVGYYVDHNHDDRYYTKAEVYSKAELDSRTVRLGIDVEELQLASSADHLSTGNGCVGIGNDFAAGGLRLPLSLPIGALLVDVEIIFFDGSTSQVYSASLLKSTTDSNSRDTVTAASTNGGSGSGGFGTVTHHLRPSSPIVVDERINFLLLFFGLDSVRNGVCNVIVEYDPAP